MFEFELLMPMIRVISQKPYNQLTKAELAFREYFSELITLTEVINNKVVYTLIDGKKYEI